jgi:hypothetical protein
MLHPLVFATQAFPVRNRTENLGTEQTVTLGLEGTVVDGLRLRDFAFGPGTNLLGRGQANLDAVKISDDVASIVGILSKQSKPPWDKDIGFFGSS